MKALGGTGRSETRGTHQGKKRMGGGGGGGGGGGVEGGGGRSEKEGNTASNNANNYHSLPHSHKLGAGCPASSTVEHRGFLL